MSKAPWVVADGNDGGALRCLRCGDRYPMSYPVDVSVACATMNAYVKRHAGCKEREACDKDTKSATT